MNTKICKKCELEKDIFEFNQRKTKTGTVYYRSVCKCCQKEIKKEYYQNNIDSVKRKVNKYRLDNCDTIKNSKREYYANNKRKILEKSKRYYIENSDKISDQKKNFYQENKILINKRKLGYQKQREKISPIFKLRRRISNMVYSNLKKNNSCKNNTSILGVLPYSIEELKQHLEKQFESWMNWNNWGRYNPKTWDDNDSLTWTWQIDHIIPHSEFKYVPMNDIEFKNCWNLDNIRPLSSKQNWIDGTHRSRHLNKDI